MKIDASVGIACSPDRIQMTQGLKVLTTLCAHCAKALSEALTPFLPPPDLAAAMATAWPYNRLWLVKALFIIKARDCTQGRGNQSDDEVDDEVSWDIRNMRTRDAYRSSERSVNGPW